jgi:hypothetical protein
MLARENPFMIMALYGFIGLAGLVLQAVTLFHAIRTGRINPWLWVILFFPLIGGVAYLYMEMWPDIRRGRSLDRLKSTVARTMDPECDLKRLREELEICESHENRMALAAEYARLGRRDEAAATYRDALQGHFAREPEALLGLAGVLFAQGDHTATLDTLAKIEPGSTGRARPEVLLLRARALEGLGRNDEAVAAYEALLPAAVGQEAPCRLALLLESMGQRERAQTLFQQVAREVARGPRHYQRSQAEWLALARQKTAAKE